MAVSRTRRAAARISAMVGVGAMAAGLILPTLAEPAEAAAGFTVDWKPSSGGPGSKLTFKITGCDTPDLSGVPAIAIEVDTDTQAPGTDPLPTHGTRDRRELVRSNPNGMWITYTVPEEFDYVAGADRGPTYPVMVFCGKTRAGVSETANVGTFTYSVRSVRPTTTTVAPTTTTVRSTTTTVRSTSTTVATANAAAAGSTATTAAPAAAAAGAGGAAQQVSSTTTTSTTTPPTTATTAKAAAAASSTTVAKSTTIPVTGGFDRELASIALLLFGVGCIVTGRGMVRSADRA